MAALVGAALVVGIAGITPAVAADAPAPLTPANLSALEASFHAQQQALADRHALELTRLEAHWADVANQRRQAGDAERAQIQAAADAATAPVLAQNAADRAAVDQGATNFFAHYDAKRVEKQGWVAQHAADLPANAVPLSGSAASAAQAPVTARYQADLLALKAQTDAAVAAATAAQTAAATQRKIDRTNLVNAQKAALTALKDTYAQLTAAATAANATQLAALVAEANDLKAQYADTVADITAQQNRDVAEAKAAGKPTADITTSYKAILAQHSSLNTILVNQNKTAQTDAKNALKATTTALKNALSAETARETTQQKNALALFDAAGVVEDYVLWEQVALAKVRGKESEDDRKAIYDVEMAVAARSYPTFTSKLAAIVPLVDSQRSSITGPANGVIDKQREKVTNQGDLRVVQARAPFEQQLDAQASRLASDLAAIETGHQTDRSKLLRRHQREDLIATTNYLIMKTRMASYLSSADASLVPLENSYNAATDPGSPYNVARTIGLDSGDPTGAGVKVALIDTGVVPVDGLAQADVTIGPDFSFEDMDDDLRGLDTNGHGTHMAGIIVGADDQWVDGNQSRTANRFLGIAPDAQLVAVKAATADGTTDPSQVIAAINWVIAYNQENPTDAIRVINLSYGTDSQQDYTLDPLSFAVERAWKAGIVVVVAAGNDGWDSSHLSNPARDPYVIAVGASQTVGHHTVVTDYSSEGAQDRGVDLVAPGRSVVSLRNPGGFLDQVNGAGRAGDRFVRGSGTSQAAAVTSGAVAVLLQQRPSLTPDQVKALLVATAAPVEAGDPELTGAGLLDLDEALKTATVYTFGQQFTPSTGTGSIEASRGTSHVLLDDGTPMVGEQDVFGLDFSASGWVDDAWSGSRWRTGGWVGSRWRADDWTGSRWRSEGWTGSRWRSDGWTGSRWRSDRWTGSRWRSDGWTGSRWRSDDWEGAGWRGFGAF